mgnify:CR=1 FL=1
MVNKRRELDYRRVDAATQSRDPQFSTTLARGLELLRCFEPGVRYLGNQELAEKSGLSKTAVSRLTYTLARLGYLKYSPQLSKYSLGTALLVAAYPMLMNLSVRQVARPFMQEMANQVQGVVSLGIRHGMAMLYVESCACTTTGSPVVVGVGSRVPLVRTAMGRAYLAGLGEAERQALLGDMQAHYGAEWPAIWERVRRTLVYYGRHGFCLSDADLARDSRAVGVALKPSPDGEQYAFNCGVPVFRLVPRQLEEDIGPRLRGLVRHVELALASRQ